MHMPFLRKITSSLLYWIYIGCFSTRYRSGFRCSSPTGKILQGSSFSVFSGTIEIFESVHIRWLRWGGWTPKTVEFFHNRV